MTSSCQVGHEALTITAAAAAAAAAAATTVLWPPRLCPELPG